ncbi:MAG: T9SS type A sorting domain-containing protein [Bacteroidia bacterium]|nr:T9SS type A sorting domain-containing protein [Bacteroidia bacterium]
MKKTITLITVLVMALNVSAQTDVKLTINHLLGSSPFAFNSEAENDMGDKVKLQRMEYYISGISITHDGGVVTDASDIYILQRADKRDTILLGNFNITTVEAINFAIGVDPGVNNANPAQWSASHALSPKNPSMHWGWASGYRFVALEGKSGSSLNQDFQIHALGNKNYFKQTIATGAESISGALVIALNADYTKAVSQIGMASGLVEHSENNEAAVCLRNFQTKVFTSLSGQGSTASAQDLELEDVFSILPVPSTGDIHVVVEDNRFLKGSMIVTDLTGREIYSGEVNSTNKVTINTKGMYFLTLYGDGIKSTKKLIIE